MGFLWQKDVPLIVTIIVAAWTWIVSEHIKQTDSLQIVEYQYDYDKSGNKILFRNISQSKSIKEIRIFVTCTAHTDCFEPKSEFAGTTSFAPPFGVIPTEPGNGDSTQAYFTFSLTENAAIVLVLHAKTTAKLRFAIVNSDKFENLKLLEESSWTASFYRNHWFVMLAGLTIFTILILVIASLSTRASKPSEHTVDLRINRTKTERPTET